MVSASLELPADDVADTGLQSRDQVVRSLGGLRGSLKEFSGRSREGLCGVRGGAEEEEDRGRAGGGEAREGAANHFKMGLQIKADLQNLIWCLERLLR